jgi:hypothetical protein
MISRLAIRASVICLAQADKHQDEGICQKPKSSGYFSRTVDTPMLHPKRKNQKERDSILDRITKDGAAPT